LISPSQGISTKFKKEMPNYTVQELYPGPKPQFPRNFEAVVFLYNSEDEYKAIADFVKKFNPKNIPICVSLGPLSKDGVKNFKTLPEA
jgi:hypothetical protein